MICKFCQKEFRRKDHPNRGKFCSRQCLADSRKGIKLPIRSKEWRENLSKALTGKKASEETKRKQSLAKKGKKWSDEQRKNIMPKLKRGIESNLYKHGKTKDKAYKSWVKNLWHRRKREADGTHSFEDWENLKAQYNWTCPSCKKQEPEIKLTEDHIIPLSRGGSDNIENIQPLCLICNIKKHTKIIKY